MAIQCGYQQAQADHNLFTKSNGTEFTALIVYVYDIVLAGNCLHEIHTIKQALNSIFHIKDLGPLKYFLGLEVSISDAGISICQQKYCLDLLSESGMLGCKPSTTPMDSSLRLHQDSSAAMPDPLSYRRLIGRLLYLTSTRLDISFLVQKLSQFMANPTQIHFQATMCVLKYLKGYPSKGLLFRRDSSVHILGFSDADWATCTNSRRSVMGYCLFIGSSLVSWKTKKQHTQPILYCDNQSALHIAANPVFHERTKHLEIDYYLVHEKAQTGCQWAFRRYLVFMEMRGLDYGGS
ncbi:uncharacterized protein LOC114405004 [Glycine soja]|uniref:uncharacterized protein LOC114405004 n=1 Tax=Glycine soja TaxID=3848 RepID=UPI00103BD505|nr:uncharacterized protein LOC114405004 [Glycine soja]